MSKQFVEQGYLDPVQVFTEQQCQKLLGKIRPLAKHCPPEWRKGYAASSRTFYEMGTHPLLIDLVTKALGEDVMLYGASLKGRSPGMAHAWHCDVESLNPSSKTAAVWIGLENTNRDSSFALIPYSHNFGVPVQEARYRNGKDRDETTDEDVVNWARSYNEQSQLLKPDLTNGQALFFDGRLWHSTFNHTNATRRAVVFQYATPDTKIQIPPEKCLDWPLHLLDEPEPQCILISGRDKTGTNRIVPPPNTDPVLPSGKLKSRIYPLRIPLQLENGAARKPYHIFNGSTQRIQTLSCHASILATGKSPHPPHPHKDEEIKMLLSGEIDIIMPDHPTLNGEKRIRLKPGQFVYYPSNFLHTLENVGKEPANYLMFKWYANSPNPAKNKSPLTFGKFDAFEAFAELAGGDGFRTHTIFREPTGCLRQFGCHVSAVSPGAGYEPHIDEDHDVAIVVLEGEIETLGERVGPHSIIFYTAGESHGLRNPGKTTAKYLVLAFYGNRANEARNSKKPRSFRSKLLDPKCWQRAVNHHFKFLGK